jgi:hypothetical protein
MLYHRSSFRGEKHVVQDPNCEDAHSWQKKAPSQNKSWLGAGNANIPGDDIGTFTWFGDLAECHTSIKSGAVPRPSSMTSLHLYSNL